MIKENYKFYFIQENQSISSALRYLNKNPDKCLIVLNQKDKLLGSLTDGDVRRAILKGLDFSHTIKKIYHKKPFFIRRNDGKIPKFILPKIFKKNYKVVPIINSKNKVLNIISPNISKFKKKKSTNSKFFLPHLPVIIMAGGQGTRLLPHTVVIPKPLIPINGKSMIEHIIEGFKEYGLNSFIITLNYKSKLIKAFFSNVFKKTKVRFINERKPLGTAGALKKINFNKINNFFLINCDSFVRCDYLSLFNFHKENKNDLTIVVSKKTQTFPYGSCEITKIGRLKNITEKPKVSLLANTGLYVFKSKVIKLIKPNEVLDMNQLIKRILNKKLRVGVFPIDNVEWQDLGNWTEFENFSKSNN